MKQVTNMAKQILKISSIIVPQHIAISDKVMQPFLVPLNLCLPY